MKILLIDDHPLTNHGLASFLEGTGRFSVSGQVNSLSEAEHFIKAADSLPSLIILDILLGEENGLEFLPFLKKFCITKGTAMPPVLVCSVLEDPFRVQNAFKKGASGYISKTADKDELLRTIDTAFKGETYIMNEHSGKLGKSLKVFDQFTKREIELLHLIKQNKNNREIAKTLGISIRTVENHISNIYFKIGCADRQELIKI
jgi:NarL family two-component system response regulator LiaR